MQYPETVLRALRRPLDPLPDPSSLQTAEFTALWNMLLRCFRTGEHLLDDLGLGIPEARKRMVAFLAHAQHRMTGMAGYGLVEWATRQFLLQHPELFDAPHLTWVLERNDELCAGYPLVAMEAREFMRRAERDGLPPRHRRLPGGPRPDDLKDICMLKIPANARAAEDFMTSARLKTRRR